jgi:integrase
LSKPFKRVDRNIYRRGDRFYIILRHDGKFHRVSAGHTLTSARNLLAKRKSEFNEGNYEALRKRARITFDEAAEQFLDYCRQNLKDPTRPAITVAHASKLLGSKYLQDISNWDIELYKKMRRSTKRNGKLISPTTIRKELLHLNRFFVLAEEWGLLPQGYNPVRSVKKPAENKGRVPELSLDEEARLLEACSLGLWSIVKFAIYTGCRQGEILSLTWDQVDMDRRFIYLEETKAGSPRVVPLCEVACGVLEAIDLREGHVFLNEKGKPYRCIKASFRRAKKQVGLTLTFHDLRHVFASRLRLLGASLGDIAESLGHKSVSTTLRYAHLTPDYMKGVVGPLDNLKAESKLHRKLHTQVDSGKVVRLSH